MKFQTTEKENERMNAWLQTHVLECKYWQPTESGLLPQGAAGGAITYCFTPTNLGLVTQVECACGEKENLTDYDEW